jgi:hypothetical protein
MSTTIPWTADQLTEGIHNALAAHDIEAVGDLLTALSFVDAHRAQEVYDTLKLGLMLTGAWASA